MFRITLTQQNRSEMKRSRKMKINILSCMLLLFSWIQINGQACTITASGISNIACNNAGTPADPTDDYITFDLNPTVTNPGATGGYSLTGLPGVTPSAGNYGVATTFTMFQGSADGVNMWNFMLEDLNHWATCQYDEDLGPVSPCVDCDISIQSITPNCTDITNYDLEICFTHANVIATNSVDISVDFDGDFTADLTSTQATQENVPQCITLTNAGVGDGQSNAIVTISETGTATGECSATSTYDEGICCVEPTFTANTTCVNSATGTDAPLGEFFIEVVVSDLGSTSSVDITDGIGQVLNVVQGTYVFGPYEHSNASTGANIAYPVTITDNANPTCSETVEIVETFCGFDPTGDDDGLVDALEDEPLHSNGFICDCSNAVSPVSILVQSPAGSFSAGGNSGFVHLYVLADADGQILATNNSGYFASPSINISNGIYSVYAFTVSQIAWNISYAAQIYPGANIETVIANDDYLCPDNDCGTTLDIYCECCDPDAGTQSSNSCLSYCADSNTGLVSSSTLVNISVEFADPSISPIAGAYNYAWIITDSSADTIINVVSSTNYNQSIPADFNDDILLADSNGNMLPIGDYCIHGINYLDGTIATNDPKALTLSELIELIGTDPATITNGLFENDGIATASAMTAPPSYTFCADLNVSSCTSVSVIEALSYEGGATCLDMNGNSANPGEWFVELTAITGGTGTYHVNDGLGTDLVGTNSIAGTYFFGPYSSTTTSVTIAIEDTNMQTAYCDNCMLLISFDSEEAGSVNASANDVCEGETISLFESGIGSTSWQWTGPNGFNSMDQNPEIPNAMEVNEGWYYVTGATDEQCSSIDSVFVTVNISPVITVQPQDVFLCPNDLATFTVEASISDGSNLAYQWYIVNGNNDNTNVNVDDPTDTMLFGETSNTLSVSAGSTHSYYVVISSDYAQGPNCAVVSDEVTLDVYNDGQLVCNDHLNLSLDANCSLEYITIDLFIESEINTDFCSFDFVDPETNEYIDLDDIGLFTGKCILFEVRDECSGNSCWGNACLEDQIIPAIVNCECETPYMDDGAGNLIPKPECVFYCHDIWDLEILEAQGGNNEILPPVDNNVPNDNCYNFDAPIVDIDIIALESCNEKLCIRTLTYNYPGAHNEEGTIECVQQFLLRSIELDSVGVTINGAWDGHPDISIANGYDGAKDYYTPEVEVRVPCGWDISPAGIAAYYDIDTPGRPEGLDKDDFVNTPNIIEHNEGFAYGYPYVVVSGWRGEYHAKPVTNNICNLYAVYEDQAVDQCIIGCNGGSKVIRTWTLLDWCDASTETFTQYVLSRDYEGPLIEKEDYSVSTDPWACSGTFDLLPPEHLKDECSDPNQVWWYVTGPSGIVIENGRAYDVPKGKNQFYYWGVDCCGNETAYPVIITVEDRVAPVAISLENLVLSLTSTGPQGEGIGKLYAYDMDNGSHDECSPIVHYEIRRDEAICRIEGNETYNNDGHPEDGPWDDDNGAFVTFCCDDVDYDQVDPLTNVAYGIVKVYLRVWDDGDMDGTFGSEGDNYNEVWTNVRVEDKLGPKVHCPEDIIINCNDDFNDYDLVGQPIVYEACSLLECGSEPRDRFQRKPANSFPFQGIEFQAYNPNCRTGAIKRTWDCGDVECEQWIIVNPIQTQEVEITWPEDRIITCLDEETYEPEVLANICDLVGVSLQSDTFYFEEGACFKVLNRWTVINECIYAADTDRNDDIDPTDDGVISGIWEHVQIVKLFDQQAPILLAQDTCYTVDGDCMSGGIVLEAVATDNGYCGSPWLKWDVDIDLWGNGNIDYSYNSNLPPTDPFYVQPTTGSGSFVSPTESGELVKVILPDGIPNACGAEHEIIWRVDDGCGNSTVQRTTFTVEDKKKPTPYCVDVSTALMEPGTFGSSVELWAKDFDAGSFDNCSDQDKLFFTFSDIRPLQIDNPNLDPWYSIDGEVSQTEFLKGNAEQWNDQLNSSSMVFNCEDYAFALANGGVIEVKVYVWDECGNYDFCLVTLGLQDNFEGCDIDPNNAKISGRISAENGQGIENVAVTISNDNPNYPLQQMTDENGEYVFEENITNTSYIINGVKRDDWLNGVSTLDLVLIQKHILNASPLNSPYKLIAADINNDQRITGIDLVELRKLILGINNELPNNDSWRFMDSSDELNTENPWPFSESLFINSLQTSMSNQNFVGVKVGDVNGTAQLGVTQNNTTNRSANLVLTIEDRILDKDEEYTIDFSSEQINELYGLQMNLLIGDLQILGIESEVINISEANYKLNDANLMISWNDPKGITTEQPIFSIKVKAQKSTSILENIIISNKKMMAEAYAGANLETQTISIAGSIQEEYALYQNEPNPWSNYTDITFSLAKSGTATLTIFDISGKVLMKNVEIFEAGMNTIRISKKDLNTAGGVCYYKLESGDFTDTKKMITIE